MSLDRDVRAYYFSHLSELSEENLFHFASRLATWAPDPEAAQLLASLRPSLVPQPSSSTALRASLRRLVDSPPEAVINALGVRAPYLQAYSPLRGIDFALFRVRHLLTLYNVDARQELFELVSRDELQALKQRLLRDPQAMRILSTYAINYLYLVERVIFEHDQPDSIDLNYLGALAEGYDDSDSSHFQLKIYFVTHCVIGETNFYARAIPAVLRPAYRRMIATLEPLIVQHYTDISLDNKLEFLVCCRICDYSTDLFKRINAECAQSVSTQGTFLVDRHNTHAGHAKTSFDASEHRNVLFIMANQPFAPSLPIM